MSYYILFPPCRDGDEEKVNQMIIINEINQEQFNWGLRGACEGGHHGLVDLMLSKGANDLNEGLQSACEGGNHTIVQLMISKGANDWDSGLQGACESGNRGLVELIISKGATDFNLGLWGACQGGHLPLVDLMIERGANYWNWGLRGACLGGHLPLVDLMISKGANEWNWGLRGACAGDKCSSIDLMFSKGADDVNNGIYYASMNGGQINATKLLINRGGFNLSYFNGDMILCLLNDSIENHKFVNTYCIQNDHYRIKYENILSDKATKCSSIKVLLESVLCREILMYIVLPYICYE